MKRIARVGILILLAAAIAACNLPVPGASGATATLPVFPTQSAERSSLPAAGAACLVGDWRLGDVDTGWLSDLASLVGERDITVEDISGVSGVQFLADGSVLVYARDARLSASVQTGRASLPATVTVNGTASGRYDASREGTLTLSDADISELSFTARVLILTLFDGKAGEVLGRKARPSGNVDIDYLCSGDSLVISFEHPRTGTETIQLERVQP